MKVQTRGEFEEECVKTSINDCFVFIRYKGRWVRSVVKFTGGVLNTGSYSYFFFPEMNSVYLRECITMVYKPEPPTE